jgi:hypothetical protein
MRDAIEMARESHLDVYGLGKSHAKFVEALERFAALVRADERELRSLRWDEYIAKAIEAEREACAKDFEAEADTWTAWPQAGAAKRKGAAAIRARGQA